MNDSWPVPKTAHCYCRDRRCTMAQDCTWRVHANNFHEVAEPFDIANFYLSNLNVRSGPYLLNDNRPDLYDAFESRWCDYCRKKGQTEASASLLEAPLCT